MLSRLGSKEANKLLPMEQCVTPATATLPEVTRSHKIPQNKLHNMVNPKQPASIPAYYLEASGGNNTACGAIFFTGGVVFR